jgi:hypothetical protein
MPLIRGHHSFDDHFTQIPNAWLRDQRISLGAIGLLAQLLSHNPGWQISQENLGRANGIGRDGVRTLINELIAAGYLNKSEERQRNDSGQLAGYVYTTKDPEAVEPTQVEPMLAEPTQVEPLHKKNIEKKNIVKNTISENRATKLPEDWFPDNYLLEMFDSKWTALVPNRDYHIENFRLYWLASGKPMKSWNLAFQKWMNTEQLRNSKKKTTTNFDDLEKWAREQDELEGRS